MPAVRHSHTGPRGKSGLWQGTRSRAELACCYTALGWLAKRCTLMLVEWVAGRGMVVRRDDVSLHRSPSPTRMPGVAA